MDLLVVPFRTFQLDGDILVSLSEVVTEAQALGAKLVVHWCLTMVLINPYVREEEQLLEFLQEMPAIVPSTTVIRDRKVYRDALSEDRGVGEMRNAKARQKCTNS